jgi:LacI family transcriptional regulator
MAVTIKDLARICGVAIATIDRALRNRPGISPRTRAMILEKVREYNYKPNVVARNLKRGRTYEIGLIVHDLDNEFFAQLVNVIQAIAWNRHYFLKLSISLLDPDRERRALEHMVEQNVDGIILFPTASGEEFAAFLKGLKRPLVTIANKVSPSLPFVGLSDRAIMHEVTEKIIRKGYRRLIFVGPLNTAQEKSNLYEIDERYEGFLLASSAHPEIEHRIISTVGDYVGEIRKISLPGPRTAIVCCSDIFALEILNDLKARGLTVPVDVGLMGFDSIFALRYITPKLSTVEYPIEKMGQIAFAYLLDLQESGNSHVPSSELVPTILWREST